METGTKQVEAFLKGSLERNVAILFASNYQARRRPGKGIKTPFKNLSFLAKEKIPFDK
jgi:hypothetical protein